MQVLHPFIGVVVHRIGNALASFVGVYFYETNLAIRLVRQITNQAVAALPVLGPRP